MDCDPGRTCAPSKYCVVASEIDAAVDSLPDVPDADPFDATKMACMTAGYTVEPTTLGLYRRVNTNANWANAEADCADDVPGATHLVVISSAAENVFIKATLGWVGLTDRAVEGTFVPVTDEINDVRTWEPGKPDGGNRENCVAMRTTQGLDDQDCPNTHTYVCECDGKAPLP